MNGKERILQDFSAFCSRVESYRENINTKNQKDLCESAYEGLYKVFERINKEIDQKTLDKKVLEGCHALKSDVILRGLLKLRTVATHVVSDTGKKNETITIYQPQGNPVEIPGDSSAIGVFSANIIPASYEQQINHEKSLTDAIKRIQKQLKLSK